MYNLNKSNMCISRYLCEALEFKPCFKDGFEYVTNYVGARSPQHCHTLCMADESCKVNYNTDTKA